MDSASPVPKYQQLREALMAMIDTAKGDHPLPSEATLCREFGISRTTVRKTLDELTFKGLIYSVQGKGTFITPRILRKSWLQQVEQRHQKGPLHHLTLRTEVVEQCVQPCPPEVAEKMGLQAADPVFKLVRLEYVEEQPFQIWINYLSSARFEGIQVVSFENRSMYNILAELFKVEVEYGEREIRAELAGESEAKLLGISSGSALLVLEMVSYDAQNIIIDFGQARQRGDLARLRDRLG